MPIYEYRCAACGHDLEALQKLTDPLLRKCPECGRSQLRRLVSAPQFRLKGSGWYETDFKNKDEKKRNLVDKPGAGDGAAKSDGAAAAGGKEDAGKAVAADKADGAAAKADKPKAPSAKAGASARKKSSAKPKAAST